MNEAPTVWRRPFEESVDLYPGLVVHDGRVSGSITTGQSRLPLWSFVYTAVAEGWEEVERNWEPGEYGWTGDKMGQFLGELLEMRGEFARLLLVLADVERRDQERDDEALEGHGPVVKVWPEESADVIMPLPWWEQPEDRGRVVAQLRRCLAVLSVDTVTTPVEEVC